MRLMEIPRFARRAFLLGSVLLTMSASAWSQSLLEKLPAGALGSLEVDHATRSIQSLKSSLVLKSFLESEAYQSWAQSPAGRKARAGRAVLEGQMGMNLWDAIDKLIGHRLAMAVYPPRAGNRPEVVVVLQFGADDTHRVVREKLQPWAELAADKIEAEESGQWWQVRANNGQAMLCLQNQWCVLSNSTELCNNVCSRIDGKPGESLASAAAWTRPAAAQQNSLSQARAIIDLQAVRHLLNRPRLLPAKTNNPITSLLFGGILEATAVAPAVFLDMNINSTGMALSLNVPAGRDDVDPPHQTLLRPVTVERSTLPAVPRRLGGFTIACDWADWYRHRDQLLEAHVLPEFDKFETGLATFLPGKDFAEDVLSLLEAPISLVSATQTYPHLDGKPGLQLPAFAVVLELKDPERGSDVFQLFFQTLGTLVNIQAGKEGRQPWVMSSEMYGGVQINFAKYLDRPQGEDLPIIFNFQPSAATIGNRFIAASSLEMCHDLIDVLNSQNPRPVPSTDEGRQIDFQLSSTSIAELLNANRKIITARSIQQGKSLERASGELDLVIELLQRLTTTSVTSSVSPDHVEWRLEGGWK